MRQIYVAVMMSAAVLSAASAGSQEGAAPRSPHKAQFERAYKLKEQKRDTQALAAFNAILQKDPRDHAALTEAGYLHASLKQYGPAAERLSAASAQDPENMRLRMDLGYVQQARKRYAEADEQFRVVAAKPGEFQEAAQGASTEIHRLLAAGDPSEAKRRRAMERGYAALNRGAKAAARKEFAAVLAADPKDEAARKQLGFLNFEAGRFAEAAADFEAVRALRPNDYLVVLQLGYTYERLKKKEQARQAFSAALDSTDARIHDAAQTALQASGGAPKPAPASSL
ncbi:MAG: tetratricopeptide repeat protein [Elusimicrobia bacterium]|nr:tetratricopeptide repeat protein [Elusimicrobiota bacterium]